MWQDHVIAVVVLAFTVSVIPMIRAGVVPPLTTTITMTLGSAILALAYITLTLWYAFAVEVASTALWGVLLVRGIRRA